MTPLLKRWHLHLDISLIRSFLKSGDKHLVSCLELIEGDRDIPEQFWWRIL